MEAKEMVAKPPPLPKKTQPKITLFASILKSPHEENTHTNNEHHQPSPFSLFNTKTSNALHNASFKVRDFAHDKDIASLLQNNPILNSVHQSTPLKPSSSTSKATDPISDFPKPMGISMTMEHRTFFTFNLNICTQQYTSLFT